MIVYADNKLKNEVKYIWKTCFPDDTDEFIHFYFKEKYKNENTLVYLSEGKAVACLQMLPYAMTFYGKLIPTAYISGAATLPSYQNKGIMKALLVYAFHEMSRRKIHLTTLIPQEDWLIRFYEKAAYTPAFEYAEEEIKCNESIPLSDSIEIRALTPKNIKEAYNFYSDYFSKINLCIQKSFQDFKAIVNSYVLDQGEVLTAYENRKIAGICFISYHQSTVFVKDLIGIKDALLGYLCRQYSRRNIKLHKPVNNQEIIRFKGMARIVNPQPLLNIYAAAQPQLSLIFSITDKDISQNNAKYLINKGECRKIDANRIYANIKVYSVSIDLLTRILLGSHLRECSSDYAIFPPAHSYMSLMLE